MKKDSSNETRNAPSDSAARRQALLSAIRQTANLWARHHNDASGVEQMIYGEISDAFNYLAETYEESCE